MNITKGAYACFFMCAMLMHLAPGDESAQVIPNELSLHVLYVWVFGMCCACDQCAKILCTLALRLCCENWHRGHQPAPLPPTVLDCSISSA